MILQLLASPVLAIASLLAIAIGLIVHHQYWHALKAWGLIDAKERMYKICMWTGLAFYVLGVAHLGTFLALANQWNMAAVICGTITMGAIVYVLGGLEIHSGARMADAISKGSREEPARLP